MIERRIHSLSWILGSFLFWMATPGSSAELEHRFSFEDEFVLDSVSPATGLLRSGAELRDGSVHLDGQNDHVQLNVGHTIAKLESCSFEVWATWAPNRPVWSRIFDFGWDTDIHMFLTPNNDRVEVGGPQNLRTPRFAITVGSSAGEQQTTSTQSLTPRVENHLVVTIDSITRTARLYINGSLVGTDQDITLTPSDLGHTPNNWLGRSQYRHDPHFEGSISEFRIYSGVLDPEQIRTNTTLGPDEIDSPTPFRRGDANVDGRENIGDVIWVLNHLFQGQPLSCLQAADIDDSGVLDIGDPVFLLRYLFLGTHQIPAPQGSCGTAPDSNSLLSCAEFSLCEEEEPGE